MARKYDEIKWLAQATAQDLSADMEKWKGFLTTAGRLYRYPFMDQLLIYAQRPDATACAERGLSDPESDREQRAGGTLNEVRTDAKELSEGTQERNLQWDDVGGESEGTLPDDSEAGRGENGSADIPDGEVPGSERSPESIRPNEVGRSDEQHPGIGGGDSFIISQRENPFRRESVVG